MIKNSDPGAENGSYRPGEELQQGQTSQRDKGRGQEGPGSKKRNIQGSDQRQEGARRIRGWKSLPVRSWQQERGPEQRRLMERERHESIARAHIYGADEDDTDSEEEYEDKEETTEDEPSDPEPAWKVLELAKNAYSKSIETSHGRRGMQAESTRADIYRAAGEISRGAENYPRAVKGVETALDRKRTGPEDSRPPAEALDQLGMAQACSEKIRESNGSLSKNQSGEVGTSLRGRTGSIVDKTKPGRRCCQDTRRRLQAKDIQRTGATGQGESGSKDSQASSSTSGPQASPRSP